MKIVPKYLTLFSKHPSSKANVMSRLPAFFICCILALTLTVTVAANVAQAQNRAVTPLNFTAKPEKRIESLVQQGLQKKIDEFYAEFQYVPYLQYSTADLNGDGKPEIIARFVEEYAFRDNNNNVDTHVFAYTTRGLIEVLEVQAHNLAVGRQDNSGLREILVFKDADGKNFDVYRWNNRKYVKK